MNSQSYWVFCSENASVFFHTRNVRGSYVMVNSSHAGIDNRHDHTLLYSESSARRCYGSVILLLYFESEIGYESMRGLSYTEEVTCFDGVKFLPYSEDGSISSCSEGYWI